MNRTVSSDALYLPIQIFEFTAERIDEVLRSSKEAQEILGPYEVEYFLMAIEELKRLRDGASKQKNPEVTS